LIEEEGIKKNMVTNKIKKVHKYRAHVTHGGGHRKKRRGAGSRGGVGNAGSGKRAGHKKYGKKLGGLGFNPRRSKKVIKVINAGYFTPAKLEKLAGAGKISKEEDSFVIDMKKLGFDKLLSMGEIDSKITFKVASCSPKAREKVEIAGGSVQTLKEVKNVSLDEKSEDNN
jgi:large subunit ribosomal protein L15